MSKQVATKLRKLVGSHQWSTKSGALTTALSELAGAIDRSANAATPLEHLLMGKHGLDAAQVTALKKAISKLNNTSRSLANLEQELKRL